MEAQNPLKRRAPRLAISAEGKTETEFFGVSDVIEEDTALAVSLHGEIAFFYLFSLFIYLYVFLANR